MKKSLLAFMLAVVMISSLIVPSFAASAEAEATEPSSVISTEYTFLDDGGYIKTELVAQNSTQTRSSTFTQSGNKFVTRYDAKDNILWRYTLTGTFLVNQGVSATCTDATYSTIINDSAWSFSNCSATKSGNEAFGVGTATLKTLWIIVVEKNEIDISIKCDVNGQLS